MWELQYYIIFFHITADFWCYTHPHIYIHSAQVSAVKSDEYPKWFDLEFPKDTINKDEVNSPITSENVNFSLLRNEYDLLTPPKKNNFGIVKNIKIYIFKFISSIFISLTYKVSSPPHKKTH